MAKSATTKSKSSKRSTPMYSRAFRYRANEAQAIKTNRIAKTSFKSFKQGKVRYFLKNS